MYKGRKIVKRLKVGKVYADVRWIDCVPVCLFRYVGLNEKGTAALFEFVGGADNYSLDLGEVSDFYTNSFWWYPTKKDLAKLGVLEESGN